MVLCGGLLERGRPLPGAADRRVVMEHFHDGLRRIGASARYDDAVFKEPDSFALLEVLAA